MRENTEQKNSEYAHFHAVLHEDEPLYYQQIITEC